jgi:hypothetical protein
MREVNNVFQQLTSMNVKLCEAGDSLLELCGNNSFLKDKTSFLFNDIVVVEECLRCSFASHKVFHEYKICNLSQETEQGYSSRIFLQKIRRKRLLDEIFEESKKMNISDQMKVVIDEYNQALVDFYNAKCEMSKHDTIERCIARTQNK